MDIRKSQTAFDLRWIGGKMPRMANEKDKKKDQHKYKGLLLRLPPVYRDMLGKAAKKHRRTLTEQAKIAFEEHLEREGLWPPKEQDKP